jgi:hypothetical protein
LADGTVLTVSRQPFLDPARILVAAGYDRDAMLFGRGNGSANWSLRGGLGDAAKLTVDETKTRFAKWKAFSSSAVAGPVSYNARAATPYPRRTPLRAPRAVRLREGSSGAIALIETCSVGRGCFGAWCSEVPPPSFPSV